MNILNKLRIVKSLQKILARQSDTTLALVKRPDHCVSPINLFNRHPKLKALCCCLASKSAIQKDSHPGNARISWFSAQWHFFDPSMHNTDGIDVIWWTLIHILMSYSINLLLSHTFVSIFYKFDSDSDMCWNIGSLWEIFRCKTGKFFKYGWATF